MQFLEFMFRDAGHFFGCFALILVPSLILDSVVANICRAFRKS